MVRSTNVVSIFLCVAAAVGCATGSDGGGDPASSVDSTDPQRVADEGGVGSSGSGASGSSGSTNDSGAGGGVVNGDSGTSQPEGGSTSGGACPGYADPNTPAACVDTAYCGGAKPACNPNGCDSTYWCNLSTKKCVKKPSSC